MKRIEAIPEVKRHLHIVLCGDNINAVSILRSLGEVGLRPTVIMVDEGHVPLVSKCRYVGKLIQTKSFDESLQQLLSLADPQCPPFVYTSDDNHQSLIDLHYDELKQGFYFFNAGEAGRVTYFMDKNNICLAAKECGFTIAESEVLKPGQLPQHIPLRAHLKGVPVGELAAVHLEAVVMLRHRHHVPRPGLGKQPRPGFGIEPLPLEPVFPFHRQRLRQLLLL